MTVVSKKPNRRKQQISEKLFSVLATCMRQRAFDPRFAGVTLVAVDVSSDLKNAIVFFSLSDQYAADCKNITKSLNHAKGYFRTYLAEHTSLRYVPHLRFQRDKFTEDSARLEQLLQAIPEPTDET